MKSIFKTFLSISIIALSGIVMLGCASSDGLTLFERNVASNIEVTDNLDNVDASDLSESTLGDLSFLESIQLVQTLTLSENPTPLEKIQEIRSLHQQIIEAHDDVTSTVSANKVAYETLKSNIDLFRSNDLILSEGDRIVIDNWKAELQEIKLSLQATIGQVYAQMRDLRGTYTLANLDHILETYNEVLSVIQARLTSITRIGEIVTDANQLLSTYME